MNYFYVYILKCRDGSFYVGHTDDLERRIAEHQKGTCAGYTAAHRPVELVWVEQCSSRDEAFITEQRIKSWSRNKKIALIQQKINVLRQLSKKQF